MSISLSIMNLKRRNWEVNPSEGRLEEVSIGVIVFSIKRPVVNDGTRTPLTLKFDFEGWLHKQNSFITP